MPVPRTRMLVATHKAAAMPSDDFYLPVHVGRALVQTDLGLQADSDGENISVRNASYCELTALYWAWKNLDAEVIGLSHYRRYFAGSQVGPNGKGILSSVEAHKLLDRYDIVLGRPRNYVVETIDSHYRNGHHGEDLDVLRREIEVAHPGFLEAYDRVFGGRKLSLYNMFIMRRNEFDDYCTWLFGILEAVAPRIDNDERSQYQQRTFGYLGERLLNVWAAHHATKLQIGYRPVINTDGEPKIQKAFGMLRRKFRGSALEGTPDT